MKKLLLISLLCVASLLQGQIPRSGSSGGGGPYDVSYTYPGAQPNATTVQLYSFARTATFAPNFLGSVGFCATNPTATATYTLFKNGVSVGTAVISTGGVFSFTGAGTVFLPGDTLSVLTPATDATLANVTFTLAGTR